MKRLLSLLVGGYLLVAVGNKVAEAAGKMRCDCADACWCKRPGLSLFRWTFPWGHRNTHTSQQKANLDRNGRIGSGTPDGS